MLLYFTRDNVNGIDHHHVIVVYALLLTATPS